MARSPSETKRLDINLARPVEEQIRPPEPAPELRVDDLPAALRAKFGTAVMGFSGHAADRVFNQK